MYKKEIGSYGEYLATEYLRQNNFIIEARNFKCTQGEVDIIAFDTDKNEIVFIEVKTRTNFSYGSPAEAVDERKKKHILASAKYYIHINNLYGINARMDVIEVMIENRGHKLNHIKDV